MDSWQDRQTIRVFRRLLLMRFIHAGRSVFPFPLRSASFDLMDVNVIGLLADLAHAPEESLDDLAVAVWGGIRSTVEEHRVLVPFEGDPAEPCDQWFSALPLGGGFKAGARPVRCLDFSLVAGCHL
jgi:hypothetical protein